MSLTSTAAPPVVKSSSKVSDTKALTQILSRLEPKILSTDPHNALRYSAFERTKTLANLEYARTLLLRSEQSTTSIKVQTRKHAQQETLLRQRALIKKLSDRLFELGQLDDGRWGSDEGKHGGTRTELDEDDEIDEILLPILDDSADEADQDKPSVNGASGPRSPRSPHKPEHQNSIRSPDWTSVGEQRAQLLGVKDTTPSGLRARNTATNTTNKSTPNSPTNTTATTTSVSSPSSSINRSPNTTTTTALETATSVQNDLTSSLVNLATQLKLSAQAFSDDLAADAEAVTRTEDALGKNKTGLDVATQRMGVLRRMSEGRWWWGRMVLYACIAGLWVVLVLLVFVGPKIRF